MKSFQDFLTEAKIGNALAPGDHETAARQHMAKHETNVIHSSTSTNHRGLKATYVIHSAKENGRNVHVHTHFMQGSTPDTHRFLQRSTPASKNHRDDVEPDA